MSRIDEIKKTLYKATQIKSLASARAWQKLRASGFKNSCFIENVEIHESQIDFDFVANDAPRELETECYISISVKELAMTEDEWAVEVAKIKEIEEEKK